LLGRCSRRRSCVECVFILEHYFEAKSFAAVSEAFSNAYREKEVPSKTTMYRMVTTFSDTGSSDVIHFSVEENERDCWFQHDGATANIANATTVLLQEFFGERIVGRGHRGLQTSPRQTSFCQDFSKKGFIRITHEAWKKLNLNRLLPILTQKHFAKSHTFSICCKAVLSSS
jgi:hypothetical protein